MCRMDFDNEILLHFDRSHMRRAIPVASGQRNNPSKQRCAAQN